MILSAAAPTTAITRPITQPEYEAWAAKIREIFDMQVKRGPAMFDSQPMFTTSMGIWPYQKFQFDDGSIWGAFFKGWDAPYYDFDWSRAKVDRYLTWENNRGRTVTYKPWPKDWGDWLNDKLCTIIGAGATVAAGPGAGATAAKSCVALRIMSASPQAYFSAIPGTTPATTPAPLRQLPAGSIAAYDLAAKKYRIAVPTALVAAAKAAGFSGPAPYAELTPTTAPPSGAQLVPLPEFKKQTGTLSWYESPTFWITSGGVVALGLGFLVVRKMRSRR